MKISNNWFLSKIHLHYTSKAKIRELTLTEPSLMSLFDRKELTRRRKKIIKMKIPIIILLLN